MQALLCHLSCSLEKPLESNTCSPRRTCLTMQRHGDGEAATGLCASGLWDNWDSKQGASVTVAALRACGADGCQLCTMLRDIVSQLKPGWLSEPKNHDASVAVKRRER